MYFDHWKYQNLQIRDESNFVLEMSEFAKTRNDIDCQIVSYDLLILNANLKNSLEINQNSGALSVIALPAEYEIKINVCGKDKTDPLNCLLSEEQSINLQYFYCSKKISFGPWNAEPILYGTQRGVIRVQRDGKSYFHSSDNENCTITSYLLNVTEGNSSLLELYEGTGELNAKVENSQLSFNIIACANNSIDATSCVVSHALSLEIQVI